MKKQVAPRFRPVLDRLDGRDIPSFLGPVTSPGGGDLITVGDFNADGRDDVAVLKSKSVVVSLSNGDGTFRAGSALKGASGAINSIQVADYNGDGKLDVRAIGETPDGWTYFFVQRVRTYTLYVNQWLGNQDGTFGPVMTMSNKHVIGGSDIYNPITVYADFNHDGVADSASVDGWYGNNNLVGVFLGNPDGSYQPTQTYAAGPKPGAIAVGDFNGDGWTDIVTVNELSFKSASLSVLLNDGNW